MREMLKLLLRHPVKLWTILLCLCMVYTYARILVLQYAIGTLLYWIHRYPRNFPHAFFLPLFYISTTILFFSAIYHDLVVLHSGSWRYVLPMPLAIKGRLYRIAGVPVYAFIIAVVESIQMFRNPFMESDLSRLATYLQLLQQEHLFVNMDGIQIQTLLQDIKWHAWFLKTRDPTTFSYIRLPLEIGLALVVCFIYGVSLFFSEPRHDGEELREATLNNDLGRVRAVLARGVDPNLRGSDGCTALHICAQQAMGVTAKELFEHKANPNIADRLGFTPLHWAVQMRREEVSPTNRLNMIRLLLSKGADPQQGDSNGRTPWMIAEKTENRPALEVLSLVRQDIANDEEGESRGTESAIVDESNSSDTPLSSQHHS